MSSIQTYLSNIMSAIYGEEVRSSIKSAIQQCYNDVNNPTLLTTGINSIITNKVADGTISGQIITDIGVLTEPTDNLFDFSKVTQGLLNTADGTIGTSTSYWTSDYIPVTAGNTYYLTNVYARVFYNTAKVYSSNIGRSSFTPSSDGYMRVSVTNVNRMKAMVKETYYDGTYIPGRSAIDYNLRANTYNKSQVDNLIAGVDVSLTTAQKAELIGLLEDTAPVPD